MAADRFLRRLCISLSIGTCVAVSPLASAVVPPSLQQRQQPADVEAVIQSLEAKANARGSGNWRIGSSVQNQPSIPFTLSVGGARWALKRLDGKKDVTIYCDGQECFEPAARLQYETDTLDEGWQNDFGQSFLLFAINNFPRQFLADKPARVVGDVTIEGTNLKQMRGLGDPEDPSAKWRAYAFKSGVLPRVGHIDYYYDPQHQAISRLTVSYAGGRKQLISTVTAWDSTGAWPASISSQVQDISSATTKPIGQAMLTTVAPFVGGDNAALQEIAASVSQVRFFAGLQNNIHRSWIYGNALKANPTALTEQVFLTQAYFGENKLSAGFDQWNILSARLSGADGEFLTQVLAPEISASMIHAHSKFAQEGKCAEIIGKLASSNLTDMQWEALSEGICRTWLDLRERSDYAQQLEAFDDEIIDGVVSHGSHEAVRILMNVSEQKRPLAAKVDAGFAKLFAQNIPATGYAGTQQSKVIAQCCTLKFWKRARDYISQLKWDAQVPESAKAGVSVLNQALALQLAQRTARPTDDVSNLIAIFAKADDETLATDEVTRAAIRSTAARAGILAVRLGHRSGSTSPAKQVTASAAVAKAADFWRAVIQEMAGLSAPIESERNVLIRLISELGSAAEATFKIPGFESETWLAIGEGRVVFARDITPQMRLIYLNKAFALAKDDSAKVAAVRAIVESFETANQYDAALQALAQLGASLTNPIAQAAVQSLTAEVRAAQSDFQSELAQMQELRKQAQLKARLQYLQNRLTEAQKQQDTKEVSAIQVAIDDVNQELKSPTTKE